MKQMMVGFLAMALSLGAVAQEEHMKKLPGYVNFGDLENVYGEPRVMINIGGSLLRLMQALSDEDDKDAMVLEGLNGIRINVYSTEGKTGPALERVAHLKTMLQEENWEPIVQVKEDAENVQIFVKADGQGVQGMIVMAVNGEEAVFINILGQFDPDRLGEVVGKFDIDVDVDQNDQQVQQR